MTTRLSGAIFPLLMTTLLAGLSFGLQQHVQEPDGGPQGPLRHDPDAIVTQADVIRVDSDGRLKYRLRTPSMVHYVDDETSLLEKPILTTFRQDVPPTTITSDKAKVNSDSSEVLLTGNVLLHRPPGADSLELQATMDSLTVLPDDAKAHTESPVDLRRGKSWMKGIGLSIDQDRQLFTLHQQARGSLIKNIEKR